MNRPDAIVIGADVGGLVAAAYLARAGKRVLVLERQAAPPEPIGPLHAMDPLVLSQLKLWTRGLRFVQRDLPLRFDGVTLGRDTHATSRTLGRFNPADGKSWPAFRRRLHREARQLRRWWWSGPSDGSEKMPDYDAAAGPFARLCVTGADAFLAAHFQSDALMAALLFDASAGGLHVSEPGAALALVWRAAQEMAGLEGAASVFAPSTLVWSLIKAAGGADFRCCATVTEILLCDGAVAGIRLADGEEIAASLVFSSLCALSTRALTGAPAARLRIAEARVSLGFAEPVAFPPVRFILAERSEIYLDAHEAARAGRLADELPMEMVAMAPERIAVTMRPLQAVLGAEERALLAARAVQAVARQIPGAASKLKEVRFSLSAPCARASLGQLLAPPLARVMTEHAGLYLCGAQAEPLPSLSGRAARLAAGLALGQK